MNDKFFIETSDLDYTIIQIPSDKRINSKKVRINCFSPAVIKKGSQKEKLLIKEWNSIFPKLDNLEYLEIDVYNQEIFDGICKIPNLEELRIVNSNFTDLTTIQSLKKLKRLELITNKKLNNIEPILNLNIKYLKIENCFNILNYELIGKIKTLIELSINGDWTIPKNLKLNSIKEFENLSELVHLDLEFCTLLDKSFESILKLDKLKRFDYLGKVDKKTVLMIKNNHKSLSSGSFIN